MTTNAGAFEMNRASIGFVQSDNVSDGAEAIKRLFSPEFRNRLDGIIQFNGLDPRTIQRVVDKLLRRTQPRNLVVLGYDVNAPEVRVPKSLR